MLDSPGAESQPNRNSVAAPQMRPWQGPMPQRVCSLASRHETCLRKAPYETSSQRQTRVDSVATFLRCGSSAVAFLSARTNPSAPLSTRNQLLRCCCSSGGRQSGYLALKQRQFHAADTGWLPRAEHIRDRGLQQIVGSNKTIFDAAPKQRRQLQVGHQMISAREVVASHFPVLPALLESHRLELLACRSLQLASSQCRTGCRVSP